MSSLGDIILTLPVLNMLRKELSNAQIDIVVKSQHKALFQPCSFVDNVLTLPEKSPAVPFPTIQLMKHLRGNKYDYIFDWHNNIRSLLLSSCIKDTTVVRYRKGTLKRRFLVSTGLKIGHFPRTVERYAETLARVGVSGQLAAPILEISPSEEEWSQSVLNKHFGSFEKHIISLGPGAKHLTKQWPLSCYQGLSSKLFGSSGEVEGIVLLGDKNDRLLTDRISQSSQRGILNGAGRFSIRQSAAMIKRTSLLITNDTGLMHVATAVQTPVLALFGPTSREFGFFPLKSRAKIMEVPLPCRPCSLHGGSICPTGTHDCMKGITVDQVLFEALDSLKE